MSLLLVLLIAAPALQAQTEERPKYAPRSEKQRNKTDEFGRKQGTWKYYSRDGILINTVEYVNDKRHGITSKFHPDNGILIEEITFYDGVKEGEYRKYSAQGQLAAEGNYLRGKRHGNWVTYNSVNGEKKSEGEYKNGKREGGWSFYNSRGGLISSGSYSNGNKIGVWQSYDSEGKKIAEKDYSAPPPSKTPSKSAGKTNTTPKKTK